ncbi:T9SS type A sorting domain-containing protein [candidate division KSB1 bacterium]|nr:T9SS type A sorting domain-containing protein [candidate division KSB1 bacterium]
MISGNLISQNQYSGIYNDSGGNNELSPPTIQSVSGGSIKGTSIPNAIIEIFSDNNNQGMHFHGETIADASGNFSWSGEVIGQNITATATDEDGNTSQFSNPVSTGIEEELTDPEPESFSLNQNYPNPFNPETVISYRIAEKGEVLLKVYDLLGQEVATLVNEEQLPGEHRTTFNARGLPSGIYFYKIHCGGFKAIRKMIVIE